MRRAAAALAVTAVAVVWLVRYETSTPERPNALRDTGPATAVRPAAEPVRRSGTFGGPGVRTGSGPLLQTPFTVLQVRAAVRDGRLVGVETAAMGSQDAHTNRINERAEPILREEALRAGSADVDAVSGATYTSRSWRDSLQGAIDAAARR
jgi:uncharacterized protein with FMN-binding domain